MDKHYKQALIAATMAALTAEQIVATEDEVSKILEEKVEIDGKWENDLSTLIATCLDNVIDDTEETEESSQPAEQNRPAVLENILRKKEDVETQMNGIIDSLKVGPNFIPSLGVAYCSDEKDLENLKQFVRGALSLQAVQSYFGGCGCSRDCSCEID